MKSANNEFVRNIRIFTKMAVRVLKRQDLLYPDLSYEIVGCAYEVYKKLW